MEGGLAGLEEIDGLHLAVAGNPLQVFAVLEGLNRKRNQFFVELVVPFLDDPLGQGVYFDHSRKIAAVQVVLCDNKRSDWREMVAILFELLVFSPFDPHQPAAVAHSEVVLVQTVKLRGKLFSLFLYSLQVVERYVYLHLHCVFLRPEEGHLLWLDFPAVPHALQQFLSFYGLYPSVACNYPHVLVIVHDYLRNVGTVFYT